MKIDSYKKTNQEAPNVKYMKFSIKILFLCLVFTHGLTLTFASQEGSEPAAQAIPSVDCRIVENLFYKTGSNLDEYERERCFLDLYLPAQHTNFPIIVWFHGGSLERGGKDDKHTQNLAKHFAENNVAVAVCNYRLSPKARYPSYIEDSAAAVAWVVNHIQEYAGNPRAVFISGHSAGGYLTLMLALDQKYLQSAGINGDEIAGVIPVGGQTFTHYTVRQERGIPNPESTPVIDEAGPCFHARKDSVPVLAICGDKDTLDRKAENRYFIALLKRIGHKNAEYLEIKDRSHWDLILKIPNPGDPVTESILTFITAHAKGGLQ